MNFDIAYVSYATSYSTVVRAAHRIGIGGVARKVAPRFETGRSDLLLDAWLCDHS